MATQSKDYILELGETFVTLLKSPICPPEVRNAIVHYLDQVRQQLDMTNPDLVMSVFNFLAVSSKSPVTEMITNSQGQPISSVFAAAAKTDELSNSSGPEPKAPAQPVTQPIPVVIPLTTGRVINPCPNLASRLPEDGE